MRSNIKKFLAIASLGVALSGCSSIHYYNNHPKVDYFDGTEKGVSLQQNLNEENSATVYVYRLPIWHDPYPCRWYPARALILNVEKNGVSEMRDCSFSKLIVPSGQASISLDLNRRMLFKDDKEYIRFKANLEKGKTYFYRVAITRPRREKTSSYGKPLGNKYKNEQAEEFVIQFYEVPARRARQELVSLFENKYLIEKAD